MQLAYTSFGRPNPTPLIILHGFFASSRNWRQIAEQFAEDYYVLVPDMRNHGASPHHEQMDYPLMSADLSAFITRLGVDQVHLLGHSMGGKIAMWYALNHPDKIDKLIVADIAPVNYVHDFTKLITALQSVPLALLENRKQAEVWLTDAIPDLNYRQFLLQNLVLANGDFQWRINLEIFRQTAANIAGFPETTGIQPLLKDILVLAGEFSDYVKTEALECLFPNAIIKVIANAGHWLHVQQPSAFVTETRLFLQQT